MVRNFLSYVLQHDVCPEHAANIEAARRICDSARRELPRCEDASSDLPGPFNEACRMLYANDREYWEFDMPATLRDDEDGFDPLSLVSATLGRHHMDGRRLFKRIHVGGEMEP